jgi:thioesterase domain-containing protein/acyl carrier protein
MKVEYEPPQTKLEEKLADIWKRVLHLEQIGRHDNFFHLGGYSILAIQLVREMEKRLGKNISVATLANSPTIAELARAILEQNNGGTRSPLIVIQPNGSRPPFFCAHGTDCYVQLAQYLGPDQPFYGLAQHLEGGKVRHTSIEDIAAHYLREVRRVQSEGPYYIGGHSLGGLIAFEMAQQIKKQGHEVGLLVLLDSSLLPIHLSETTPNFVNFPLFSRQDIRRQLWIYQHWLKQACQKKIKTMACEVYHCVGASLPTSLQMYYVDQVVYGDIYSKAHRSYVPRAYAGRVVYLKSEDPQERTAGWEKLIADKLEFRRVPGYHLSMLAEPNVRSLAEQLKQCLTNAQKEAAPSAQLWKMTDGDRQIKLSQIA